MKKYWKLIIGVIFIIGGVGNIGKSPAAVIFGLIVGFVFIICQYFLKINKHYAGHVAQSTTPNAPPTENNIYLPKYKDGVPRQYVYPLEFVPSGAAGGIDCKESRGAEVEVAPGESGIDVYFNQAKIGTIPTPSKLEMLKDWIKNGDPYLAVVSDDPNTIKMAFYRDKQKHNQFRNQSVVALMSYKTESAQDALSYFIDGDEVELDEDGENVRVIYAGEKIGRLSKSVASKVISEGVYAAFLEKCETVLTDDSETIYRPHVRIYW